MVFRKNFIRQYISIAMGVMSTAFGLESFLLPNSFIDGGITGISLLLDKITSDFWSLQFFLVVLNTPFVILAFKQIGKEFALRTSFTIAALALVLTFVHFPSVTEDKLLAALFGGFFIGAGTGMAIRGGSVVDGTEVFAVYISRNLSLSVSDVIIIVNVVIFLVAGTVFSVESALYSILTYLVASKTIDFIIDGIEEYTDVKIITTSPVEVREMITEKLGWGVTIYNGKSGYNLKELEILSTIITRLEITKLKNEVALIDADAFIITQSIKDVRGGMVKKKPLH